MSNVQSQRSISISLMIVFFANPTKGLVGLIDYMMSWRVLSYRHPLNHLVNGSERNKWSGHLRKKTRCKTLFTAIILLQIRYTVHFIDDESFIAHTSISILSLFPLYEQCFDLHHAAKECILFTRSIMIDTILGATLSIKVKIVKLFENPRSFLITRIWI